MNPTPSSWEKAVREELITRLEGQRVPTKLGAAVFWRLGISIEDDVLEEAIRSIPDWINEPTITAARKEISVTILLQLLHRGLADVSLHSLWPAVTARFSSPADDKDRFAQFFRPLLLEHYPRQLRTLPHPRFVYLLIDQAGVGKNRKQIISDFLRSLISQKIHLTADISNLENELKIVIEYFVKERSGEGDVEFFEQVLLKTATTLIHLSRAVFESNDRNELTLWTWEEIQAFWFQRSGKHLDEVIPEAKEVFLEAISAIGGTINRHELLKILRSSAYSMEYPQGVVVKTGTYFKNIPLMPVKITKGGHHRRLQVVDETGLSAKQVSSMNPDRWHCVRQHFIFYSSRAFEVEMEHHSEPSAPVLKASADDEGVEIAGYFWSGTDHYGALPRIVGTGVEPEMVARFKPKVRWSLIDNQLKSTLAGFWLDRCSYSGKGVISVAGQPPSSCYIRARSYFNELANPLTVTQSDCTAPLKVNLSYASDQQAVYKGYFPWRDQCFWTIGERLSQKPYLPEGSGQVETSGLLLFTPSDSSVNSCEVDVRQITEVPAAFAQTHDCYKVAGLFSANAVIYVDDSLIYIDPRRVPAFSRPGVRHFQRNDITLRVTGDLVIPLDQPLVEITLPGSFVQGDWLLGISDSSREEKKLGFELLENAQLTTGSDNRCLLDIVETVRDHVLRRDDLFRLRILHRDGLIADEISVFIACGRVETIKSLPGHASAIVFSDPDLGRRRYESDNPPGAGSTETRVGTTLHFDDKTGVALVWQPLVSDCNLVDATGTAHPRAQEAAEVRIEDALLDITGDPRNCRFFANGEELFEAGEDSLSLAELLRSVPCSSLLQPLNLVCQSGSGRQKSWTIDACSRLHKLQAQGSNQGGISITATWAGVHSKALTAAIFLGTHKLSEEQIFQERLDGKFLYGQCDINSANLSEIRGDIRLGLTCKVFFCDKCIGEGPVRIAQDLSETRYGEDLKPEFRAFLGDETMALSAHGFYLLVLLSRYLYENPNGLRVFPESGLLRWVENHFSDYSKAQLLSRAVALIARMATDEYVNTKVVFSATYSAVSALLNSAYVINEGRKWRFGVASPKIFQQGEDYFSLYLQNAPDDGIGQWCEEMISFCSGCMSESAEEFLAGDTSGGPVFSQCLLYDDYFFSWKSWQGR
jgi:hypothetical protein